MPATEDRHDAGPDGKVYADAVLAAGQRSRGLISVILVLLVVTYVSIRNNQEPNWSYERVQVYAGLLKCLEANDLAHRNCQSIGERIRDVNGRDPKPSDVVDFARSADVELEGEFGSPDFKDINAGRIKEVDWRYHGYVDKDVGIRTITIPVFGAQIDYNDMWLLSGVIMFSLLLLLWSSIRQEYRNLAFIAAHKPEYLHLVLLNQVITRPHLSQRWLYGKLPLVLWLMPTVLYAHLLYLDFITIDGSYIFIGRLETYIEYAVESAAVVAMAVVNVLVVRSQSRLQDLLDGLAKETAFKTHGGESR